MQKEKRTLNLARSILQFLSSSLLVILAMNLSAEAAPTEKGAKRQAKTKAMFKTTMLPRQENIPNVPAFPGKVKFVRGLRYGSLGNGDNCIVQTFYVKEQPDTVREWYRTSLASYNWSVQSANAANTQILARRPKDGASCHIMVSGSPDKEYKCLVQLRYVQFHPLGET